MIRLHERRREIKPDREHRDVQTETETAGPREGVVEIKIELVLADRTEIGEHGEAEHLYDRDRVLEVHAEQRLAAPRRIIVAIGLLRHRPHVTVTDAANGLRPAEEHTVVDRHIVRERIDGLRTESDHKDVIEALPDVEVATVVEADAPVLVITRRRNVSVNLRPVTARRDTEVVATVLDPEDDVVYLKTKGEAHIPTKEQIQELLNNTITKNKTINGVTGKLYKSNINGNTIFIPFSGDWFFSSGAIHPWSRSCSSSIDSSNRHKVLYLFSSCNNCGIGELDCYDGFSVRGVKDK